jgi:hypothetical protein
MSIGVKLLASQRAALNVCRCMQLKRLTKSLAKGLDTPGTPVRDQISSQIDGQVYR